MALRRTLLLIILLVLVGILVLETMTGIKQEHKQADRLSLKFAVHKRAGITQHTKKGTKGNAKSSSSPWTQPGRVTTSTRKSTSTNVHRKTSELNLTRLHSKLSMAMFDARLNDHLREPEVGSSVDTSTNKTIILIVAYLRSGSTFTASLFSHAPQVFYIFEPLHMLAYKVNKNMSVTFLNDTVRSFPVGRLSQELSRASLEDWMTCRFSKIDRSSLMDDFHLIHSHNFTKSFIYCVKHRRYRKQPLNNSIKECLDRLELKCNTANIRAFKTIRLSMESAEHLLNKYNNLKVVHLVRDPRGMFLSQTNGKLTSKPINFHIKEYCDRIADDIKVSRRLLKSNNENFLLARYEDIAMDPYKEAERLYKFAGIEFSDELQRYVNHSTSQNVKDDCAYCTTRGNSTRTAFKWRSKITLPLIRLVNKYCDEMMSSVGYLRMGSLDQVQNETLSTIRDGLS